MSTWHGTAWHAHPFFAICLQPAPFLGCCATGEVGCSIAVTNNAAIALQMARSFIVSCFFSHVDVLSFGGCWSSWLEGVCVCVSAGCVDSSSRVRLRRGLTASANCGWLAGFGWVNWDMVCLGVSGVLVGALGLNKCVSTSLSQGLSCLVCLFQLLCGSGESTCWLHATAKSEEQRLLL